MRARETHGDFQLDPPAAADEEAHTHTRATVALLPSYRG